MGRKNLFSTILNEIRKIKPKDAIVNPMEFPAEIHVELTNKCNMKCRFCPTGQGALKRPKGFMAAEHFINICWEAQKYGAVIRLVRWGEPTLHPDCYTLIRSAKKLGVPIHMNTNGVDLDCKRVLQSGLDSIKISVHSKQSYQAAKKLLKLRGEAEKPFVTIAYLSSEKWYGTLDKADKITRSKTVDLSEPGHKCVRCYELFSRLSVDWDGTISACCGDYDRLMSLGHLDKHKLKDIWVGEELQNYRELAANNRLEEVYLCNRCHRGGNR